MEISVIFKQYLKSSSKNLTFSGIFAQIFLSENNFEANLDKSKNNFEANLDKSKNNFEANLDKSKKNFSLKVKILFQNYFPTKIFAQKYR